MLNHCAGTTETNIIFYANYALIKKYFKILHGLERVRASRIISSSSCIFQTVLSKTQQAIDVVMKIKPGSQW